jgi:tetratricopeptide (TPR) repeat protein
MTAALGLLAGTALEVLGALLALDLVGAPHPLGVALAAHAAAAVLAAPALGGPGRDPRLCAAALAFSVPVAGLLALAVLRLIRAWAPPIATTERTYRALAVLPMPERAAGALERVYEWLQQQLSVQPFADMLGADDPRLRRAALDALSRRPDARAVALLRAALEARDRDTQVGASGALRGIEERLARAIEEAREAVARRPRSAAAACAAGEACLAYVEAGLVDPAMERSWIDEAEAAYRRAIDLDRALAAARRGLARVLVLRDALPEAEEQARRAWAAAPGPEAALLLAEILFLRGRYAELRRLAREAGAAGRPEPLAWWAGAEGERA